MKITYLGSGAAEGIPAMFCECDTCKKAFLLGGKNIRSRSQALIDDRILIDLPADTYLHFIQNKFDSTKIKACIITHSHGDHLYAREMTMRRIGFVETSDEKPLTFYATSVPFRELEQMYYKKLSNNKDNEKRIAIAKINPFVPFVAEGYKITPLKANHDKKADAVFYIIEKDNKSILYGHDTGMFPKETWEYLIKQGINFNLVSLDSTYSTLHRENLDGHMNLQLDSQVKDKLISLGLADENTIFVANHFSHSGGTYDEVKEQADKIGFVTSYDSMSIEF